jgi:hypothetical protein
MAEVKLSRHAKRVSFQHPPETDSPAMFIRRTVDASPASTNRTLSSKQRSLPLLQLKRASTPNLSTSRPTAARLKAMDVPEVYLPMRPRKPKSKSPEARRIH